MAGLYIHIPFCLQKCAYCDFYSRGNNSPDQLESYLEAAGKEMEFRRRNAGEGSNGGLNIPDKIDTVYIGGGTPTALSPDQLQSLLDKAARLWDCSGISEITLEANPEDLTDNYITALAGTGFNRLSIGVQSFDDSLLRVMNRRHSALKAKKAIRAAQEAGFRNITIDLIYGVPGMTGGQWERSLQQAVELGVQHISAYHLTIEPGTVFGRLAEQGKMVPVHESESLRQYETLRRTLGDAGFEHYEISNFARPRFRATHNSSYWSGEPYLGIGPSAHSYDGDIRSWAIADTAEYIAGAGTDTIYESERLSETDFFNELVMTSLRRAEGLDVEEMNRRFGQLMTGDLLQRAEVFTGSGSLVRTEKRLAIPPENFLTSDYIISTLFASD